MTKQEEIKCQDCGTTYQVWQVTGRCFPCLRKAFEEYDARPYSPPLLIFHPKDPALQKLKEIYGN